MQKTRSIKELIRKFKENVDRYRSIEEGYRNRPKGSIYSTTLVQAHNRLSDITRMIKEYGLVEYVTWQCIVTIQQGDKLYSTNMVIKLPSDCTEEEVKELIRIKINDSENVLKQVDNLHTIGREVLGTVNYQGIIHSREIENNP